MCFYIDGEQKALVAHEDIKCYKRVIIPLYSYLLFFTKLCTVISRYNYYLYSKGVLNPRISLHIDKDNYGEINEGYHSYIDNKKLWYGNRMRKNNALFVIPKGSYYYQNLDNEYVSETIIFKRILL